MTFSNAYLLEVVDDIAVDGGAEVAQLADVWHLARRVAVAHVVAQVSLRLMVLFTDTAHQHVGLVLVDLSQ